MEEENAATIEYLVKKHLYVINHAAYSSLLRKVMIAFKAFFFS